MHITGQELALASLAVAAISVVAGSANVRSANRNQRRLAHLERISDRQIDTYVELLRWAGETREAVHRELGMLGLIEALSIPAIIVTAVTGCQFGSPRGSSCRCTMPAILAAQWLPRERIHPSGQISGRPVANRSALAQVRAISVGFSASTRGGTGIRQKGAVT